MGIWLTSWSTDTKLNGACGKKGKIRLVHWGFVSKPRVELGNKHTEDVSRKIGENQLKESFESIVNIISSKKRLLQFRRDKDA